MPLPDKVQVIKHIAVPTNKKQLRSVIGVTYYYREMWKHRLDIFKPFKQNVSQAGVSPKLIKYHANYLISTDDVHKRS